MANNYLPYGYLSSILCQSPPLDLSANGYSMYPNADDESRIAPPPVMSTPLIPSSHKSAFLTVTPRRQRDSGIDSSTSVVSTPLSSSSGLSAKASAFSIDSLLGHTSREEQSTSRPSHPNPVTIRHSGRSPPSTRKRYTCQHCDREYTSRSSVW